jgi:hypothetical protein
LLMVLSVKRQQNTIKKNPEALLHARKEIWLEANLEKIRHVFLSLPKGKKN